MKTKADSTSRAIKTLNSNNYFRNNKDLSFLLFNASEKASWKEHRLKGAENSHLRDKIFTEGTVRKMETGQLPDLWKACHQLVNTVSAAEGNDVAMQLIPVMQRIETLGKEESARFLKNPENRHVLVSNSQVEVVLIHWKPGKASDIHAHPGTGCLFKLLQGKLEELRYTPDPSLKLLGFNSYRSGNMAYIDDRIAYHHVGNPYGTSAISLHVYFKQ